MKEATLVGGTAEEHYNAGYYSLYGGLGCWIHLLSSYLANPSVAYSTASGTWRKLEQFWLAMYNRGLKDSVFIENDVLLL